MKKWLILFPALFLLAGCQLSPPSLSVKADGEALDVYQGSYCWQAFGKGECADTGGPADVIGEDKPRTVEAGSEAVLSFWGDPETLNMSLEGSRETVVLTLENGKATVDLPDEPGVYLYSVSGHWEQGDTGYFFQVKVE